MSRTYLILVVLAGMFGAMVSNCSSRGSMRSGDHVFSERAVAVKRAPTRDSYSSGTTNVSDGAVELQRSSDGHFYADVQINGATIHALVDTGATHIALSRADAGTAGIATSIGMPGVVGQGADGAVHGEIVTLDRVTLGHKSAEGMSAVVLNSGGE